MPALTALALFSLALDAAAAERVLVVSIDGLRSDAVTVELTPSLAGLKARGASTLGAESLEPTFTIPNHVSMLTGLTPAAHGITAADDPGDLVVDGTILELAHARGLKTALYLSKAKLRLLAKPGALDRYVVSAQGASSEAAGALLQDLEDPAARWHLAFLHIAEPDAAGHGHQWMSPEYLEAVREADRLVGRIVGRLEELGLRAGTLLIVLADHGGAGSGHASPVPEVRRVPWIATGARVRGGAAIGRRVHVHDTAPTVLRALGLEIPLWMEGAAVDEVFEAAAARALRGDADSSGAIGLGDALALLRRLFAGEGMPCAAAGDVNADGAVNLTDPIHLLGHLFRGGPPPAQPYPECGAGSMEDELECARGVCP
ncbi:MAG: alkaline phosphatase family protein [Planctomycetes bacterium]|nr:alkaline phosphatase family protein [Planctomycetota bacterium]